MTYDLLSNLEKLHTTELGVVRIKRNLHLDPSADVVSWCKQKILSSADITRKGKNWYATADGAVITINAKSFTIITAHQIKETPSIRRR